MTTQRLSDEEIHRIMSKRMKAIRAMPHGQDKARLLCGHTSRLTTNNIDTPKGYATHSTQRNR